MFKNKEYPRHKNNRDNSFSTIATKLWMLLSSRAHCGFNFGLTVGRAESTRLVLRPSPRDDPVDPEGNAKAMPDGGGKRQRPSDLSSPSKRKQRRRKRDNRDTELNHRQSATVVSALTAMVVTVGVVASGISHVSAPEVRRPIYEARRLSWEDHESNLDERDGWRKSYRMDKQTSYKLAELPALSSKSTPTSPASARPAVSSQ